MFCPFELLYMVVHASCFDFWQELHHSHSKASGQKTGRGGGNQCCMNHAVSCEVSFASSLAWWFVVLLWRASDCSVRILLWGEILCFLHGRISLCVLLCAALSTGRKECQTKSPADHRSSLKS